MFFVITNQTVRLSYNSLMKQPDAAQTESLHDSVCTLLRILTVAETEFAPADGKMKYSGLDFQSIGFIGRNAGCMASELAQFLDVAPTTATSTVDRLVKRGLVNRERPEDNRRAVALSLTASGLQMFEVMVNHDMRNMQLMLGALRDSERAPFVSAMAKIAKTFTEFEAAAKP
jgi:DNA-binding MarR family transcriptional regulator